MQVCFRCTTSVVYLALHVLCGTGGDSSGPSADQIVSELANTILIRVAVGESLVLSPTDQRDHAGAYVSLFVEIQGLGMLERENAHSSLIATKEGVLHSLATFLFQVSILRCCVFSPSRNRSSWQMLLCPCGTAGFANLSTISSVTRKFFTLKPVNETIFVPALLIKSMEQTEALHCSQTFLYIGLGFEKLCSGPATNIQSFFNFLLSGREGTSRPVSDLIGS